MLIPSVLAYIAFALPAITREERVEKHKEIIFQRYTDKQQEFLAFVLEQYIDQGVSALDQEKLPDLLELKYHTVGYAVEELGRVSDIREVFNGFQEHLYLDDRSL